jgi:glutamate N-acetyltransferase/amino-acid N-acetyltransferase
MAGLLQGDPRVGTRGMMTTDTHPKGLSFDAGNAIVTIVAKGSGMIEPNMATMLVYIFTDAALPSTTLHRMLAGAAHVSFNMLSIDTDTSTSDTCVIMANGLAGPVAEPEFAAALTEGCLQMTEMLARDGEGATKLLRVTIQGARSEAEARQVAKSVVNSPLIKTMAYGADPNIGRVLMAVGKCFECAVEPARLQITINGTLVFRDQLRVEYDEARLRTELGGDPVDIGVDLGVGTSTATAYGCDLTDGYIRENAAYYSS